MLRFLLGMAACGVAGALPAIVPAALGQTQTPPTAAETPPVDGPKPTAYACAGEQTFLVVYKAGEAADLVLGTRTFTLKQVPAGSGFRYTDGTLTLVGKGREAILEGAPGGALRECIMRDKP
ncbi:MAG: MliC family protein [Reyranellaceae bacterium]